MQLECTIENINSETFPYIHVEKIRQVAFINNDRNEIQLYTALLIGGSSLIQDIDKGFVSQLTESFKLKIEFGISDDAVTIQKISTVDMIKSFFDQIDKVQVIWGKGCKQIRNQAELHNRLSKILGVQHTSIDNEKTQLNNDKILLIEGQGDNGKDSILYEANFAEIKDGYEISGKPKLHEGIGIISWVKTTISLTGKLSAKENISLKVLFPLTEKGKTLLSYVSLYICPPEGYHILEDSKVRFFLKGNRGNEDENNNLTLVTQNQALYYREWVEELHIENRSIYRLNKEKLFKGFDPLNDCEYIEVNFSILPNTEKGSLQFVMGAFFSAAITFGIDSGRLKEASRCFWPIVPPDIQWYMVCLITFFAFLRWSSKKDKIKEGLMDKIANGIYRCGMAIICCWCAFAFLIYRLDIASFKTVCNNIPQIYISGMLTAGICLVSAYVYLTYRKLSDHYYRRPISRELFF